jgi:hypothetical protein
VRTLQWSGLHSTHASGITDILILFDRRGMGAPTPPLDPLPRWESYAQDLTAVLDKFSRRDGRRAWWWSGWAGGLGGGGGWRCLGEPLCLLDELAEPLDGPLVGAEVVALQGLLGAPVLLGLLLEDPRQRR